MSVRASILGVLTLGAAYGLQVHTEIETRSERIGEINVGQIYSTLARLRTSGLVEAAELTRDGLPLYELTTDGRAEAERWLTTAEPTTGAARASWHEMVDHVLIVSSLPHGDVAGLVESYRQNWRSIVDETPVFNDEGRDPGSLRGQAERMLAESALAWLDQVVLRPPAPTGPSTKRPRRGRRPALMQV
ncbi:PadR family transcriptional regulator [Subtercola endophyticus]|uniref:PadR family transcriptional regulator n=1 Tax=Subtercola endophyticus TaxID=2895559 RepID=UPI001E39EBB8|nr:PadR family transcriptional regulator [Subtercola endophyticus]UFS60160.1 PadR family transcriptional regulator [Subtercola endophyticus]